MGTPARSPRRCLTILAAAWLLASSPSLGTLVAASSPGEGAGAVLRAPWRSDPETGGGPDAGVPGRGGRAPWYPVDILEQNLTVELFPQASGLAVNGSLRLQARTNLTSLTFFLHETLVLTRAEDRGHDLLPCARDGQQVTFELPHLLEENQQITLKVAYGGTLRVLENGKKQDWVGWEGAFVKGSTFWYLMHHNCDWTLYNLTISCPPNWTGVADGELVAEERTAERANFTWANDEPCMRPAFAAGNYTVLREAGGVELSVYTFPEHAGTARAYLDEARSIIRYYDKPLASFGRYDRSTLKIVETAHETDMGYACSGMVMLRPAAFASGTCDFGLLSHELAHQYFPFMSGYWGWGYVWLWEGFSEYLACRYEMATYRKADRLERDREAYLAFRDDPREKPVALTGWEDPLSFEVVYCRGAWVLHMLSGMLGEEGFNQTLWDLFFNHGRYGLLSAGDFIGHASANSPVPLEDFFQQWLNTTEDLDASLSTVRSYENGTAHFLELEPVNLLKGKGWTDVGVEYASGRRETFPLKWDGKARMVPLDVPERPERVSLDPGGWQLDVDRTNQEAVPVPSGRLYDLEAGEPWFPFGAAEEELAEFRVEACNNCTYPAEGAVVEIRVDGHFLSNITLDLGPMERKAVNFTWRAEGGRHVLTVICDAEGKFKEVDELDNAASLTVDVGPPLPVVDLWAHDLALAPWAPWEGDSVNFSALVTNLCNDTCPGFELLFLLDGNPLASRSVGSLPPGGEVRLNATWKAVRGNHDLVVRADPAGLVKETDEGNNVDGFQFFTRWPLRLGLVASPPRPRTFEPVTLVVEGEGQLFDFDFGDGTELCGTAERSAVHEYRRAGNFTVKVLGRYGEEVLGSAEAIVQVQNRPPDILLFADPPSPLSLETVNFTARTLDLDGTVKAVLWAFGDGTTGTGGRLEHAYARPGNYTARARAVDSDGAGNETSILVPVRNRPPEVRWTGNSTVTERGKLEFRAEAVDLDGSVVRLSWDFGDGSSASGPQASHVFKKPGRWVITLTAWDDWGANASFSAMITVTERVGTAGAPAWPAVILAVVLAVAVVSIALVARSRRKRLQEDDFFIKPGK